MHKNLNIKEIGSFTVGGRRVTLSGLPVYESSMTTNGTKRVIDPNGDFWAEQMYVQYVKLAEPQAKYPLMLWHGGGLAGSCWETTPDGREGWQMFFLRAGHDVYVSDAVERGRASWARYPEIFTTEPIFRPYQHAWESFRIGPKYDSDPNKRDTFPGSQYPKETFEASMMQAIPRWSSNNTATQKAYEEYVKKVGPCVILVHSQGCAFAAQAALTLPDLIKAIIFIEPSGMPNPQENDLSLLADIPQIFIWGDYLDEYETWNKSTSGKSSYYKSVRKYYESLINVAKKAEWLELPDIGITGNTHMMMHDRNSLAIAGLIQEWIKKHHLMN